MFNILDRDNPEKNRGTFGQIEDEARKTGVPVNVLLAIGEKAGVNDPDELLEVTRAAARELGPAIAEGGDIKEVIRGLAGDQADSFLTRAREIGETLYPERMAAARAARVQQNEQSAEDQPGAVGNAARSFGGGLATGVGSAIEGVGQLADAPLHVLRGDADYEPGLTARLGRAGGDFLRDLGNDLRAGMSDDAKLAIQQSMPEGNIFKPSTWSMGENPSPSGYALLVFDVLGSFAPVLMAGIATGGTGAAAVGGAQSAGAGADMARQVVEEAFAERDANGVSALERESGYFRELRAAGMSEEEAFEQSKDAAGFVSSLLTAPIGALGGAATTAVMRGALPAGVGQTGGALRQGTTRAAIGGLEEGFQEAVEGVAARFGTQVATDMEVDLAEDTFADFLMGALGGAPVGGVAGALQGAGAGREDDLSDEAGTPLPDQAAPSPSQPPLSQQAQPVEPPAKPGSMAAARQEGTRRTTPQPDTGAEMVSPQPGMPGVQPQPPEAGPVAASAPQPQSGGTGQQIPATLEFRGDIAPENVVIVGETETGIQLMDPETGEIGEISRADIEAGIVTLTPRDDVVTGRPAEPGAMPGEAIPPEMGPTEYDLAVQEMGEIAGNLTSVGQAERTLADIDGIAREFGEGEDLRAIRARLEAYIAREEEAAARARNDESLIETPEQDPAGDVQPDQALGVLGQGVEAETTPAVSPDIIARPDGTPFKSANALRQKITRDGMDPAAYDIVEREGGFVAVAKQEGTNAGVLDELASGDQANAAGRPDQQEEGQEAAQIDRGERPDQPPSPNGGLGGGRPPVSAQTGQPAPSLNTQQGEVSPATTGEQTDGIQQGQQEGLRQQGREEEVARPRAEDFPDLNFEDTGGAVGRKRTYPGFVISRNDSGGLTIRRERNGELVAGAPDMNGVRRIMATQRNPFTGEAFSRPEPAANQVREVESPQGSEPARPRSKNLAQQRTPLTNEIIRLGGIAATRRDPATGERVATKAASELSARGITPKTHPRLFKEGGKTDLDNVTPSEIHEDMAFIAGLDDTGGYLSEDALYDAIASETGPAAAPFHTSYADRAEYDAILERRDRAARGLDSTIDESAPNDLSVTPRAMDEAGDKARINRITRTVSQVIEADGLQVTEREKSAIVERLNAEGGNVLDAIQSEQIRSVQSIDWPALQQEIATEFPNERIDPEAQRRAEEVPFGDEETPARPQRSEGEEGGASPDNQQRGKAEEDRRPRRGGAGGQGTASWVIRNKETGEVVMETTDRAKVDALNTEKYEAVPIREYLASINGKIPTAEQFDQIAAQTDPNPTPAQAEAENYKTGKTDWRGLKLSIENRKGTVRSKMNPDGTEAWSVTMPAHYGRILRTEGADGDHVDFYMGDNTDSDRVFVVDQKDAETGAFDEHKVMLGFNTQKEAKDAYLAGFSDGKGPQRWGGVTAMSVADLGQIIGDKAKWQKPMKMKTDVANDGDGKPTGYLSFIAISYPEQNENLGDLLSKYKAALQNAGISGMLVADQRKPSFPGGGAGGSTVVQDRIDVFVPLMKRGDKKKAMTAINSVKSVPYGSKAPDTTATEFAVQPAPTAEQEAGQPQSSTTERTPEGEQAVIPGTEQSQDQRAARMTDRQRAEVEARQKQSKMRRLDGNTGDAGPLFDDQGDMFAPRAESAIDQETAPKAVKGLTEAENNQLAELEKQFLNKFKDQTSSGLDPDLVAIALKIGNLYVRAGRRRFRDLIQTMMERMGLTLEQAQPYARNAYNQIRDDMDLAGDDVSDMDSSNDVMAEIRKMRAEESRKAAQSATVEGASTEGDADVSDTSGNLEPSRGPQPGDGLGAAGVPAAATPDRSGAGSERAGASGAGRGSVSGERLPANDAASMGARGDSAAGAGASNTGASPAQRGDGQRGDTDGQQGSNAEQGAAAIAEAASSDSPDLKARLEAQKAADRRNAPIVPADPENIAETLPLLFESQHEDVLKAETRFQKPDGHGMMFTNGTGTGKTFTGLGVVKRFTLQGKDNILIVAPTQGIMSDWIKSAEALNLDVSRLEDTKDAGQGIVITTYANMGENTSLASRDFDLVVADESHNLMSSADASPTSALDHFRAISGHPSGLTTRAYMLEAKMHAEVKALRDEIEANRKSDDQRRWQANAGLEKRFDALYARFMDKINAHKERLAGKPRSKAVFLSATPFAYDKNVDYAEGYLFEYPKSENRGGYNQAEGRDAFMVQNFGYRMRYNKLTRPEGEVNSGVMERQFHEKLKADGALSARVLDVDADYSRAFALIEDSKTESMALGQQIDRAVDLLWSADDGKYRALHEFVTKRFDYLTRMRLLEAIKAEASIDMIKADLALNRKIVVFHDYNTGGGIKIFDTSEMPSDAVRDEYHQFKAENPWIDDLDFSGMRSPIDTLKDNFPNALLYNGRETKKAREEAKRLFNEDGSGFDLIVVQSAAGEAGISLHDTTGKHQRVLLNLGMPTRPTTAIQEEGRIYRVGQVTNAIFRYLNTGTDWERFTFAQRIAERASTAENLAMGEQARALKESFIDAFGESEPVTPGAQEGTGGKGRDRVDNSISAYERAKTFYFAQQKAQGRRNQREGADYYATPEPVGFKMVELADIKPGEKVLEPSAGHGAIARFFPESANSTIVEPEMSLLSRAMLAQSNARSEQMRFEDLHVANKYDAIVMNPPYGAGGKTAMEHVAKAMKHLRNGGRIVALIPEGPSANKRYDALMESVDTKDFYEVAEVKLPTATFGRAGTSVKTRIVVIEKHTDADVVKTLNHQRRDYDSVETVNDLFDRMEDMTINARREPLTKDEDVEVYEARGKVTLGGHKIIYTPDAVKVTSRLQKPMFAAMAKEAETYAGFYDRADKSFSFPDMEARDNFLEAIRKGIEPAKPDEGGRSSFTLAETTHAKKGIQLFVASMDARVSPDEFNRLRNLAKANGGYWSAYTKMGAIPGFQFESAAERAAFMDLAQVKESESRFDTAPATETPAFKRWFGDSKVVDADGKPLVVYHGTAHLNYKEPFEAFNTMAWGAADKSLASDYATTRASMLGAAGKYRLIEGYMKVERPFNADLGLPRAVTAGQMISAMIEQAEAQGRTLSEAQASEMRSLMDTIDAARRREESGPHYSRHDFWNETRDLFGADGAQAIQRAFEITGFDGVTMIENGSQTWGVFKSEQFKSANNIGTFDGNDPRIMQSRFDREPVATPREIQAINRQINAEMSRAGLDGKVTAKLVRGLANMAGAPIQGRQRGAQIEVNPDSADGAIDTLRHEIVHALRDEGLWGKPYGLFTRAEWQGLVAAARADKALMARIDRMYPDLGQTAKLEEGVAELYRLWARNADQRSGLNAAFQKIRSFFTAIANAFRGRGFNSTAQTFERIASGRVGGRGPDGPGGAGRSTESRGLNDRLAAQFLSELAATDDIFVSPRATSTSLEGVFGEIDPSISFVGDVTQPDEASETGADRRFLLRTNKGRDLYVFETDDSVWFDVSRLEPGEAGSRVYSAVADYALNNRKEFIGDPAGLSDEALRRRTEAMLSSAIKHGTTDHLAPHQRQIEGDAGLGVPPLTWTPGDTEANIQSLINVSIESLAHHVPEFRRARYDFQTGAFRTGEGKPIPDAMLNVWAEHPRVRAAGAGRRTLKRGILLNSLAHAESSQRPGLLEQSLRQQRQLVSGLRGTFYSRFDPARRPDGKFASKAAEYSRALLGDNGKVTGTKERGLMGQILTDAMGGRSDRTNLLALVPGEPLMRELAKGIRSAQKYLNLKHDMSAMKNNRQAIAAGTAEKWGAWSRKNGKSNDRMMGLMHDATIAGLDPAEPFTVRPKGTNEGKAAYAAFVDRKKAEYDELRKRWDQLPVKAQEIYREVRDAYREVADTERGILIDNVAKAMEINLKNAQRKYDDRMREIEEEGLTGDEKEAEVAKAKERLAQVKKRDGYGRKSRLNAMRLMFEQNEVPAPYFPLMRHGNYYITLKNADGGIESFSKFETARKRDQAAAELRREYPEMEIKIGTMPTGGATKGDVDPTFVNEVEALLAASNPDPALMDAIWQKYIESLPDLSMRKSRIHRKGTPGYSSDAFRNFSHQMFHSATQLARLKYGQDMRLALDDAHREADESADPDRAQLVINEMEKRHDWVMNPQSSAWSTVATTAAFVYYLGATPGAALVNLSQTVVVGIPVLAAAFEKGTIRGASRQLSRALRQFGQSKGNLLRSKHLTDEEKAMLRRAHDEGVVEKTQNHDLTNYAESGIAYNDRRQKVMGAISWMFHQAEVLNREITFIAALRMAKESGMIGEQAYQKAKELDYKVHFDYQSESRPRLQFNDWVRVFTIFRNYQLNMLFRLFRDLHQSFNAESEADRREARGQLIGITGMMMLMAGVSGTWGYALLTTLAGMFLPGGADEAEEEVKEAIVNVLGRDLGGALLKGVPGHMTGIDLSSRMGMPELWFRRPDRQQEGQDLYNHWLEQLLGPAAGIVGNQFRAYQAMKEGEWQKGFETAVPKAIRDVSRSIRYSDEGVTTWNGNPIIEDVSPIEALTQALGFTPARVSERYEINRFMKNEEMRIRGQRTRLMGTAYDEIKAGGPLSDRTKRAIAEFNAEYPSYPITADSLRASFGARARGETETVDGVRINRRLDQQIREDRAPYLYQ